MQSSQQTKICTNCGEDKPLSDYWMRKSRIGGQPASRCKPCSVEINRQWRKANPDYEKKRYASSIKETREKHLVRKYGVTLDDYDKMLTAQNGCCAICAKPEKNEKHGVFHVDHCHDTGRVRGLLCNNCNQVLGRAQDDREILLRAADYLVPQIPELIGRAILAVQQ
jgi:hypothetical protein